MDPDQLASKKPAELDLHCFQNGIYSGSAWKELRSVLYVIAVVKSDTLQ